ncbi:hypothetical protein ACOME3_003969 [Neoechinorhynchus agilis]
MVQQTEEPNKTSIFQIRYFLWSISSLIGNIDCVRVCLKMNIARCIHCCVLVYIPLFCNSFEYSSLFLDFRVLLSYEPVILDCCKPLIVHFCPLTIHAPQTKSNGAI